GIDSDAPGFKKIKIVPHLGVLTHASGAIPHPNGNILVNFEKMSDSWKTSVTLPSNTPGYLLWKEKRFELKPGENFLMLSK
ncbi:MAG: alpha-L-rhamnosidase C-terminal domain-containing protein, partial [Chitinophagales bacterium]